MNEAEKKILQVIEQYGCYEASFFERAVLFVRF